MSRSATALILQRVSRTFTGTTLRNVKLRTFCIALNAATPLSLPSLNRKTKGVFGGYWTDKPEEDAMIATIRPLKEDDIPAARRIVSQAFGTFAGAPEPEKFMSDRDQVGTRWHADPSSAFAAEIDGELVGSNFATRWGSVGFFGPMTIRPDMWDKGLGKKLMAPVMECLDKWNITHAGLFTFAQSAKHIGLYQKYGFWPRFLTAIMSKPVQRAKNGPQWSKYSEIPEGQREETLSECRDLTNSLYPGFQLDREIRAVEEQKLGETVLVREGGELVGFAVCHCGPGTEAGNDKCYVKFGAVKLGTDAEKLFDRLLDACEALAASRELSQFEAGVNMARHRAYGKMLQWGFRTTIQGVTMHRPNDPGYSRPDVFLIDDWR